MAVHVYWAVGGKAGKAAALPTAEGRALIKPSALGATMVAVGLSVLVALVALRIGWLKTAQPRQRQHVRADWHLADRSHARVTHGRRLSLFRLFSKASVTARLPASTR